jgi:hypothetical protein
VTGNIREIANPAPFSALASKMAQPEGIVSTGAPATEPQVALHEPVASAHAAFPSELEIGTDSSDVFSSPALE